MTITTTFHDGRTCILHTGTDQDGTTFARQYRTDRTGCGLWVWKQAAAEWKQIIGSGQVSLRGARSTIRRRFKAAVGIED